MAEDGRIHAVSITENAGGHPALSPEVLGHEIMDKGLDIISHFSCKDKNRNQMESLLFAWDRLGLHNLLVITGDYPKSGYCGDPKPVFDLDSVHVVDMITHMNQGHFVAENVQPSSFFMGVAISPFKLTVAEQTTQYYKLHRKVAAGAHFAITQLGFDARKYHETLLYVKENQLNIPLLGNVFIPNLAVAELMYQSKVPGCIITDEFLEQLKKENSSPDKGKKAGLARGAKLIALLKGTGYSGAHIGGPGLSMADLDFLLTEADALLSDWRECVADLNYWSAKGAYFYSKDEETGLNFPRENPRKKTTSLQPVFSLSKGVHNQVFEPEGHFYKPAKQICLFFCLIQWRPFL